MLGLIHTVITEKCYISLTFLIAHTSGSISGNLYAFPFIKVTTELDNPFIKYLKSVQSNIVPTSQN